MQASVVMGASVLCVSTLLVSPVLAAPNGPDTTPLTPNGSAKIVATAQGGSVLFLTPAQQSQAGSVFTTQSIGFNAGFTFSTFFQFKMTDPGIYGASDGMTFVLQTAGDTAVGSNGGDLGYVGIAPSVAVEFDTWQNAWDINDNHVAILTDGQTNDLDPQTPYGVTNCQPSKGVFGCMSNGDIWSVWIDYDGTNLNVALADNSTARPANLLSYAIDIPAILGQDSAFVGFTAATGAGYQNHVILDWRFSETHPPAGAEAR